MNQTAPTKQNAALWLMARRKMPLWANTVGFTPAKHHQLLINKLEGVARGDIKRLMVFMPPGSAKSTYGSVLFPAWFLNRCKDACIIAASHTQELADTFGRRVRNLINEYAPVLGYGLAADSQAAGRWSTSIGGEYFACGVGGSITGRRADLAIIDDPVKSREDAASDTVREKQWEWFKFDLMTRLKPHARIVLIMTRWHEDDLAGRLIAEGTDWDIVRLPMEAEDNDALGRKVGEPLWPEYFTDDQRISAKSDVRVWTSLYQQRPVPESGGFFKRDWLKGYTPSELPKQLRYYLASDHAVSTKESADYTCLLPVGVDSEGVIWVLPDPFWERADADVVVEAALKLCHARKPLQWWAESGHISKSIGPFLRKRMMELGIFTTIDEVVPSKDKQTRAQSIKARMSMGMVRFPKFAPWWTRAEAELLSFDGGKHDDFVDALAHIGMGLDQLIPAHTFNDPKIVKGSWADLQRGKTNPRPATC